MKILVAGCGKIGQTILASLLSEGHDIIALDNSPEIIAEITNIYDVMGICGNCTDAAVLTEAGIGNIDLFIAVTGSDEKNMLACFFARRLGAHHTIARIRNPEYKDTSIDFMRQHLDLSLSINPDRLAAKELYNMLRLPFASKIETFSRGFLDMIEFRLKDDSPLNGVKLCDIKGKFKAKFLVSAVQRGENVYIPDGSFELKSGDKVGVIATPFEITKLMRGMGVVQKQAKSVMILGGSRTARYLAQMLISGGNTVKIIESNRELCKEISDSLPGAIVICGDGAEQELLLEEGIRNVDAFVSLTGMDEENILIAIFAQSQNVPKVISKVNKDELEKMAERLGLESSISPKHIISNVLLRYVRALQNSEGCNVETLYKIMDGKAEALEFSVRADFGAVNIPLKDLQLIPNVLIAGIIRDRKTIIPGGDDIIKSGDRVVVIASDRKLRDLSGILK